MAKTRLNANHRSILSRHAASLFCPTLGSPVPLFHDRTHPTPDVFSAHCFPHPIEGRV